MAFISILIVDIIAMLFFGICLLMFIFLVAAAILKLVGKKKDNKVLRVVGNIFLVLGIVFSIPVLFVTFRIVGAQCFKKIDMPDGSTKVVTYSKITKMNELCEDGSADAIENLSRLLDKNECLVYYYDSNYNSVLDKGLKNGNVDIVETALAHGAVLDDSYKYEHMSKNHNSMEFFVRNMYDRTITASDVELLKLLFENGAATTCDRCPDSDYYSNIFGEAVRMILYHNDDTVTDTELDLIQVFLDNGMSDSSLLLCAETDTSDSEYTTDVIMDENYDALLRMIEK